MDVGLGGLMRWAFRRVRGCGATLSDVVAASSARSRKVGLRRRVLILTAAGVMTLAACTSGTSPSTSRASFAATALTWCGTALLPPLSTTFGRQTLTFAAPSGSPAPIVTELPASSAFDPATIAHTSNLVITSGDCDHGAIVEVDPPDGVVTLGVAYAPDHTTVTAFVLGRLRSKPGSSDVSVQAYDPTTGLLASTTVQV